MPTASPAPVSLADADFARRRAIAAAGFARATTDALLADFPEDRLLYQSAPGANHALWTIGHLAAATVYFRSLLDGSIDGVPTSYLKLFGYGSTPLTDRAAYPPVDELRRHRDSAFAAFVRVASDLPPSELLGPPAQKAEGLADDKLAAIERLAWHEGWHSGQISGIRRALGMKGLF